MKTNNEQRKKIRGEREREREREREAKEYVKKLRNTSSDFWLCFKNQNDNRKEKEWKLNPEHT
ncbi:unnamed protein product [Prunus brigantina]